MSGERIAAMESVSMDMWPAFINATLESIPGAEEKIAFDKFHVAKYLGEAVDKVRREEHKALMAEGRDDLKGSKYTWQYNPQNMRARQWRDFKSLRKSALKTARGPGRSKSWQCHYGITSAKLGRRKVGSVGFLGR
uniref:Transposase n=2 Tax=Candidatus Kentrum sp. LPFa TaxID=2126335 RepID=A0A450W3P2_9GAMM|nr:MAG: Transposase [Candidatus Kentron sp. LPFa]VFK27190.1 MAG: Transposase [Candidatus Kentron sp. LPFa]VFK36284.1 MAG: Transposase [Candidatus Kentron sp. LPFa]